MREKVGDKSVLPLTPSSSSLPIFSSPDPGPRAPLALPLSPMSHAAPIWCQSCRPCHLVVALRPRPQIGSYLLGTPNRRTRRACAVVAGLPSELAAAPLVRQRGGGGRESERIEREKERWDRPTDIRAQL